MTRRPLVRFTHEPANAGWWTVYYDPFGATTMRMRAHLITLALFLAAGSTAGAQNPVEVGVDAQVGIGLDDQGTSISIPAQKIRAGFMLTPVMTLEPSLGFVRLSNDGSSFSTLALDLSLLYHLSASRAARQFYLRPVVGLQRVSISDDDLDVSESETDLNLGLAGGMKVPLLDRVGARFEVEFRNYMSDPSMSALNLNFGLSYFTR